MKTDLKFWLEFLAGFIMTICATFGAGALASTISYTIQGHTELISPSLLIILSITTLLSSLIGMYFFTK